MLINFKVSNYLSFNSKCEFNMLAGDWDNHKDHIIKSELGFDGLKSGIIYGANASGKSNFIKAIAYAKKYITEISELGKETNRTIFKLEKDNINKPSKFDFVFETENRIFNYGFEVSSTRVEKEWLFEIFDNETEKLLFERKSNGTTTAGVEFGERINFDNKEEKMRYKIMAENTRPNQLFLTRAITLNETKYFKIVYEWFKNLIVILTNTQLPDAEVMIAGKEKLYTKYLKFFDTGIERLKLVETENFPQDIIKKLANILNSNQSGVYKIKLDRYLIEKDENGEIQIFQLATSHKSKDRKEDIEFELSEESEGTIRMIDLLPLIFAAKQSKDAVILVDEIDRSLHPLLVYEFFKLFFKETSDNNSQIIATTHSSHLLDLELFREDEIWFVQKFEGETEMHSLAEFNPETYDQDEIETGYLLGIFGGTPMFKQSALMRDKNE